MVSEDEMMSVTQELHVENLFKAVDDIAIPGTMNTHFVKPVVPMSGSIIGKFYLRLTEKFENELFGMEMLILAGQLNTITIQTDVHAPTDYSPATAFATNTVPEERI